MSRTTVHIEVSGGSRVSNVTVHGVKLYRGPRSWLLRAFSAVRMRAEFAQFDLRRDRGRDSWLLRMAFRFSNRAVELIAPKQEV